MASITIYDLAGEVRTQLRLRAAGHGHSIEEEARMILCQAVAGEVEPANVSSAIRARFAPLGGVELKILPLDSMLATAPVRMSRQR